MKQIPCDQIFLPCQNTQAEKFKLRNKLFVICMNITEANSTEPVVSHDSLV